MNITDWNNDEILRLVMAKDHVTQNLKCLKINQVKKFRRVLFRARLNATA